MLFYDHSKKKLFSTGFTEGISLKKEKKTDIHAIECSFINKALTVCTKRFVYVRTIKKWFRCFEAWHSIKLICAIQLKSANIAQKVTGWNLVFLWLSVVSLNLFSSLFDYSINNFVPLEARVMCGWHDAGQHHCLLYRQ